MNIALFGNTSQDNYLSPISSFIEALGSRDGVDIAVEQRFLDYLRSHGVATDESVKALDLDTFNAELALCFGGDGTFLNAAGAIAHREIPLMGINTGHLGYLSGCSINDAPGFIDDIVERRLRVERRTMLQVEAPGITLGISPYALNEIAILKKDSSSMIHVATAINDIQLADYQCDGLLISTPTGSTAYNLSAGGPLIDPEARVTVLSPIAPHTLTMRPLVVSDTACIKAVPTSRTSSFRLSVDGHSTSLPNGTPLKISRAPFDTLLGRPYSHNFINTLRDKLLWGK